MEYTPDEIYTWEYALSQLQNLFPLHACAEYNAIVDLFNFSPNEIPQLEDMSNVLRKATGWQVGVGAHSSRTSPLSRIHLHNVKWDYHKNLWIGNFFQADLHM